MYKCICLLAAVFYSGLCQAVELANPVLAPIEVITKVENYLLKNKLKTLQGYHLSQINFVYYSEYKSETGWMLSYSCDATKDGIKPSDCGFFINVTNGKNPEFYFRQINV